ncbi:hypothetical protein AURDEDRAFT_161071 [Auricularia subglabra TFB-10046 SS5]|nr:hypothetical protein AURDEDRAFT_161071 [Auricularia subglabra TFB-10046 SS5]
MVIPIKKRPVATAISPAPPFDSPLGSSRDRKYKTFTPLREYESYPFLRLCAGDWKVRAIGRDQYSGWFNKNPELKALAASSNIPDLEVDEDDEEEVAPVRSKRRRTKQVDALRPRKRQKTVQAPAQLEAGPGEGPVPLPLGAR